MDASGDAGDDAQLSDADAVDAGESDAGDDATTSDAGDDAAVDAGDDAAADAGDDAGIPEDAGMDAGFDAGGPCTGDDECAPIGWCRVTRDPGISECTPWQLDGDFCGGFTLPFAQARCEPSLRCTTTEPLIPDSPGACALEATITELAANPGDYDGRWVVVSGNVEAAPPICTRIECAADMPCCNGCTAAQVIRRGEATVQLIQPDGMPYQCAGNECNYFEMCTAPNGTTTVIGEFDAADGQITVRHIYM